MWCNLLGQLAGGFIVEIYQSLQQATHHCTLGRAGAAKPLPLNLCEVDVFFHKKSLII